MVSFARIKAKTIFSKLLFTEICHTNIDKSKERQEQGLQLQKEKNENHLLEAIKKGGIWLS